MIYITADEKQHGKECHQRMVEIIRREFPNTNMQMQLVIQNKVARLLKKLGNDIIQVWITAKPTTQCQYQVDRVVMAGGETVHVQIQVD